MGNASVQRGLFLTFRGFPSSVTPYGVPPSPWGKAASRRGSVHRGPDLTFRGPLHTRPGLRPVHPLQAGEGWSPSSVRAFGPATFPVGEGCLPAGEHSSGAGLNFQGSPPHPARATPGPPSPSRRGQEPLIRHALRRATFPAGEGDLPAGEHLSGGLPPVLVLAGTQPGEFFEGP